MPQQQHFELRSLNRYRTLLTTSLVEGDKTQSRFVENWMDEPGEDESSSAPLLHHGFTMNSTVSGEKAHEKSEHGVSVTARQIDAAAQLSLDVEGEVDPAEALRVRKKIDKHILPMMCVLYWIQFMDKTTLGSAAILGIQESAHLSASQYNWLGTVFYLSYLLFEYPQNLALQRFPVGKWMSINIFVWAIALCAHAACHSFGGLFAVRLILGMCEGSITAGFMIVSSMFYTRTEQTLRVGYWFLMNGTAQIIMGFLSFGLSHTHTHGFEPWQWLMVVTGVMTLIVSVVYWIFFPDSPATAWFLTRHERAIAVQRIKSNQTGTENKHFKTHQMIEALKDPKTWLFALFSCLDNIPNSLTNQSQIIVSSFGFTVFQTTLLGIIPGVIEIVTIFTGVHLAARFKDSRAFVSVVYFIPNILGSFMILLLPWHDKIGLLFGLWLTGVGTTGFVLSLSWIGSVTAGHTKRITTNAIMLGAYCVGNAVGPLMWKEQYKPRNRVPWTVITICTIACPLILLVIRTLLSRENRRRDAEPPDDTYNDVYLEGTDDGGSGLESRVDKAFLDLTDIENRDFRYVL